MTQRNETIYQTAQDWMAWNNTKRFLAQPPQRNILDRSERSNTAPDASLSPDLAAFNIAIKALQENDMPYYIPFMTVYCGKKQLPQAFHAMPVKSIAAKLGIEPPAFYDRAHNAASRLHKHAIELLMIYNQLRNEMEVLA